MLKNYFKITLRNLLKRKIYSIINISGLAVGMASVVLITLYLQDELNFDGYHTKADRIYRLTVARDNATVASWVGTPAPLAPAVFQNFPDVEGYVRIDPLGFKPKVRFSHAEKTFYEEGFILADPALFDVFDFNLLQGNRETALAERSSLVITQSVANKYFGDENPIGKTLNYDGLMDFVVSGVMEDVPTNSHFTFNFVASFEFMNDIHQRDIKDSWGRWNYYTYILLSEHANPDAVVTKSKTHLAELFDSTGVGFYLQPLTDIYLRSKILRDPHHAGDIMNVYIYGAIAIFILLLACINFMNLYTANSEIRSKEIGMRKVMGAHKKHLITQFLSESFVLAVLALPLAVLLVEFVLPAFNQIAGKELDINYFENGSLYLGLFALTATVGLISGSYPAFFLSAFRPAGMLRGKFAARVQGLKFRNLLVVFQFVVSVVLIAGTLVISNQMHFVHTKKLGYDRENIMNVPLYGQNSRDNYLTYRNEIVGYPSIVDATATSFTPSVERWRESSYFEGRQDDDNHSFYRISGDHNFIDLFGMELIAGRTFDRTLAGDLHNSYILNEAAVRAIGWELEQAIGKGFGSRTAGGKVIGVVQDFNFRSLRRETHPLSINVLPRMFQFVSVKVLPGDLDATINFLQDKWQDVNPGHPFEYYFYDDEFDKLYKSDLRLRTLFGYFAGLSIFVACLGLFGLSLFAVQQRRKEIGIRKVLGASVASITALMSKNLLKLVLLANVIGWPVAAFVMNLWLKNFAYRINLSTWTFVLAGSVALLIALITVSSQAIKSALANPTDTLQCE